MVAIIMMEDETIAKKMIDHYNLKDGDKILDVVVGILLFEFQKLTKFQ